MKKPLKKLFILLLIFSFPVLSLEAQNITGIWRGMFVSESGDQYKFELQILQDRNYAVSGVSYSYLDKRFYGKATLTGRFKSTTDSALVQEIRTVEVRMDEGSVACIMKCNMEYVKSGKEEFLEGIFTSKYEKTDSLYGRYRGGDCGGGRVYLRKVITSDFYIEPFLRKPVTTTKTPPKTNNSTTRTRTETKKPVVKPKTNTNNNTSTSTAGTSRADSTIKSENKKPVETEKVKVKPVVPMPEILKSRTNELVKTITVSSEEITIKLYDNGEIDDDTISVFFNRRLVLSKKRLTAAPLTFKLKMDEADPEHDLVMVAENLGRIPPNTSLMYVYDGEKRHELRITSTEQKNAMIRFRYVKRTP